MSKPSLRLFADVSGLPLQAVTEKIAFLGRTGSGKTYAAMKLAEEMLVAGAQILALDAVGKWYGLRVAGPGPGFEVPVFGGLMGDYPLEPTGGKLLADLVVDRAISAVIDVSQFTHAEQTRFALDFATYFYQRKKAAPSAVHVFLEECQEFVPQNAMPGEQAMLAAFERLWKLGRNFGIGGSLISQRPQEINKKALNQSGTLVVFGMTGPQERKAIEAWVSAQGINEDIAAILPTLKTGQPHVWSPAFGFSATVQIAPKRTADVSSTPEVGKGAKARPLTPIDREALATEMAATIERAKVDDPKELRKELARVRQELERAQRVALQSQQASAVSVHPAPALTDADRELLKDLSESFREFTDAIATRADAVLAGIAARAKQEIEAAAAKWTDDVQKRRALFLEHLEKTRLQRALDHVLATPGPTPTRAPVARPAPPVQPKPAPIRQAIADAGDAASTLGTSGAYRMLCALAWHAPEPMTLSKLALRTGISRNGGTFRTYLGKLKTLGWADGNGHGVVITDAGRAALADDVPAPPRGEELIAYWQRELGNSGARRMFDAIVAAYPHALSAAELEAQTSIAAAGGTFRTYLGQLRTLDLVTRGEIRASEELFS